MNTPTFVRTGVDKVDQNFDELRRHFFNMNAVSGSREVSVTLTTGDNNITTPITNPRGRVVVFQSAAASLFDKGLAADGTWVINASAPCTVHLAFF